MKVVSATGHIAMTTRLLPPLYTLASCLAVLLPSPTVVAAEMEVEVDDHSATLQVQVQLDRAHFSPGEIDGVSGGNTSKAIAAFQVARGLEPSGLLDSATLAALSVDVAPILVSYTVTEADVAGPFAETPRDMIAKSKLSALGFNSAREALGERFHASPGLLQKLNPGASLTNAGEVLQVPNVEPTAALAKASKVVVDRSDASVSLLDTNGVVIARFPASTGSKHDPLPTGDWTIKGVARNPVFNYNPALFWDANPAHGKATLPAGPNNPVGLVWIDLSKPHYGIHGTPEPRNIGKTESHGCIRLSNWNALTLADAVATGMTATLQE